jgi:hypothetical protein
MVIDRCSGRSTLGPCPETALATDYWGDPVCAWHAEYREHVLPIDYGSVMRAVLDSARALRDAGDDEAAERCLDMAMALYDAQKAGVSL